MKVKYEYTFETTCNQIANQIVCVKWKPNNEVGFKTRKKEKN